MFILPVNIFYWLTSTAQMAEHDYEMMIMHDKNSKFIALYKKKTPQNLAQML